MLVSGARGLRAGGPEGAPPALTGGLYDVIWEGRGAGPWALLLTARNPDWEPRVQLSSAACETWLDQVEKGHC